MSLRRLLVWAPLMLASSAWAHDDHAAVAEATSLAQAFVDGREASAPEAPLVHAFDHPGRLQYDFFPLLMGDDNDGPRLGDLDIADRRRLEALLRGVLGDEGLLRVQAIRSLEDRLAELQPNSGLRVADAYATRFFGRPSTSSPWTLEFEGHHLSVNATVVGDELRGTPLFLGSNPAEVQHGSYTGLRVLARQEDLARELLGTFTEAQLERATSSPAPAPLMPGSVEPPPATGLPASAMTVAQRMLLRELVASYASNLRPEFAQRELERLDAAGLKSLHFAWFGSTEPGEACAYLVRGPTVVLRFDLLRDDAGPANHVHALWSDPEQDFGHDLLARHHAEHDHGAAGDDGR